MLGIIIMFEFILGVFVRIDVISGVVVQRPSIIFIVFRIVGPTMSVSDSGEMFGFGGSQNLFELRQIQSATGTQEFCSTPSVEVETAEQ